MRKPIEGTVARGELRDDDAWYRGLKSDGTFLDKSPVVANDKLLDRGHERYDIFCAPCHDRSGSGQGKTIALGFAQPPSFHVDSIRNLPDGQIFDVISNGVRNMPSYKEQIPVGDRWAILVYLRWLQDQQEAGNDK